MAPASPFEPASPPVPFSCLDFEVWKELAIVLEPTSPLSKPGDWRNLASKLQYGTPFINYIIGKEKKDGSCTLELFREYSSRSENSVEEVMRALEKMSHWKAHSILKKVYPDLRREYDSLLEQKDQLEDLHRQKTRMEDKRRFAAANGQTHPKRHCPDTTTPHLVPVQLREAQENSHYSGMIPPAADRGQHQTPSYRHAGSVQDERFSVLPHISVFNRCHEQLQPLEMRGIQSMEMSSMNPQCGSLDEADREEMDNDSMATDINHNGIVRCDDFVPIEEGLVRHLHGDQCDIGAEEEVVTSTTSEMRSSPMSVQGHQRFQSKQRQYLPQPQQQQQWVNRNIQSGGQMIHARVPAHMQHEAVSMSTEMSSVFGRKGCERNPGNTYPRVKQNSSINTRTPGRFPSLPGDIKINKFSEASRKIRVFITYANDSDAHVDHVLKLAECLKKNKFSVSIDMYEFHQMATDKVGWLETRFKNADFILVCVSEQYKADVETCDMEASTSLDHTLNTKFIYKLMQTEYHERASTNKRFIPLLFPGVTKDDVPTWLQNTLIYNWPSQYRDLFFFISKPDRLIDTTLGTASSPGVVLGSNGVHPTIVTRSYSGESTSPKTPHSRSMTSPKIIARSYSSDSTTSAEKDEVML